MPGKLAAARASREALERLSQLPRRPTSTQGGLPTELEDGSTEVGSTTFARVSGGRLLRGPSTDAGPASKQHEAHASSQSVTFLVSSGQHLLHGTPTATTAALANHAEYSVASGAGLLGGALSPRSPSNVSAHSMSLAVQPSGISCPRSTPAAAPAPPAAPSGGAAGPPDAGTAISAAGSQRPNSLHHQPSSAIAAAGPSTSTSIGIDVSVCTAGGAAPTASTVPATEPAGPAARGSGTAAGQGTVFAAAAQQVWTAMAPSERVRSANAGGIGLRHSRLRVSGTPSGPQATLATGPSQFGSPPKNVPPRKAFLQVDFNATSTPQYASERLLASGLSLGDTDSAQAAADSLASPGRDGSNVEAWTASAVRPLSPTGSSSTGRTTPNTIAAGDSFISGRGRGQPLRRQGATGSGLMGFGTVSELFIEGGRTEEALSARSSFTVRQTPSDVEDEVLERARTRRAIRAITLASMGVDGGASGGPGTAGGTAGSHALVDEASRKAAAREPPPPGATGEAGSRPVIRLIHQPGHHRRPPNRHASMPAMKQEGAPPRSGVSGGVGNMRRSTLRSPLSGGLAPEDAVPEEEEEAVGDAPSNTSLQLGLLGDGGAGGGGGDRVCTYSRMPSDSPITSQMSVTSSTFQGLASTAQPRNQSLLATAASGSGATSAAAAAAAAASIALAPEQPPSRLGGNAYHLPGGLLCVANVVGRMTAGGSSGQRPSFEEEGGRATPAQLLGASMATIMSQSNPQLALSTVGLTAGDRPSHVSGRLLSGAHAQTHSNNLAALHKAVERLMLQDSGLYAKVQASMKGISSLAKETNKLEFTRDASGATVINQYVVVKTLGRGAFGKVKLCLNTLDGLLYAVKMINRAHLLRQLQKSARPLRRRAPPPRNTSDTGLMNMHLHRTTTDGNLFTHTNINNFGNVAQAAVPARASMDDTSPMAAIMREIAVMKKVDHPHVVRLHEVIDPPGSSYLMMVMEYCEGGCVMETRAQTGLTPLGEDRAREYFRQACQGLDYLHYNNVIHGDLKPENMLVSGSGLLKIADFGSSRFMGGDPTDATKTSCTPAFQSPEEIAHMPVDPFAADLWALACCLFCFVFGRLPFVGSCVVDIYRAILTRPHSYPDDVPCSPGLRDLLERMLDKDPKKRLALREVGQHEWVTAGGQLPPLPSLQLLAAGLGPGGEAPPPVIHVTHAEQVNAIDRSSLVSLIRARLKEKTCQPGEYLFKEGEEAHCVYMIMAGVVEMTQHIRRAGGSHGSGAGTHGGSHSLHGTAAAHGAGGDGHDGASTDLHDASFSVDLDESLTLDHSDGAHFTEAMNIVDGKLHIDRQQAIEMRRRMQGTLLGDNAEYVVEVKGPGSVIGEMGLDTAATATHRVSARARGPVTVVKLTEENFFKALLQMYSGGGGGSAASTTLTASSLSEVAGKGGAAGTAAAPGVSTYAPGLSAQHIMVMQYLEDSGSFATYQAPNLAPSSAATNSMLGGGGRFSMDAGAGPSAFTVRGQGQPFLQQHTHSTSPRHSHHHATGGQQQGHRPHKQQQQQQLSAAGSGSSAISSGLGRFARPAIPSASTAFTSAALNGGVGGVGGGKTSGVNSMLGVLNTIHSVNASRGSPNTDEGVADL